MSFWHAKSLQSITAKENLSFFLVLKVFVAELDGSLAKSQWCFKLLPDMAPLPGLTIYLPFLLSLTIYPIQHHNLRSCPCVMYHNTNHRSPKSRFNELVRQNFLYKWKHNSLNSLHLIPNPVTTPRNYGKLVNSSYEGYASPLLQSQNQNATNDSLKFKSR